MNNATVKIFGVEATFENDADTWRCSDIGTKRFLIYWTANCWSGMKFGALKSSALAATLAKELNAEIIKVPDLAGLAFHELNQQFVGQKRHLIELRVHWQQEDFGDIEVEIVKLLKEKGINVK